MSVGRKVGHTWIPCNFCITAPAQPSAIGISCIRPCFFCHSYTWYGLPQQKKTKQSLNTGLSILRVCGQVFVIFFQIWAFLFYTTLSYLTGERVYTALSSLPISLVCDNNLNYPLQCSFERKKKIRLKDLCNRFLFSFVAIINSLKYKNFSRLRISCCFFCHFGTNKAGNAKLTPNKSSFLRAF